MADNVSDMAVFRVTQPSRGFLLAGLLITLFVLAMAIPKTWEEATKIADDGSITLADDWAETVERKVRKYERHDLYALVASKNGYYLCKQCLTGKFYLKTGEIYRYGTTGNGKDGRGYTEFWLVNNALSYVHMLSADMVTVRSAEANLIGAYALHPENLRRPLQNSKAAKPYWYRLALPPGNNRLD